MAVSMDFTRKEFPFLRREIDGHPIVYLDNASTTPKPQCVIDAVVQVYHDKTANVHRGVHTIADEATAAYENARREIASFLNASPAEIIFTRNATEGINIVANGLGLLPEDEVVLTRRASLKLSSLALACKNDSRWIGSGWSSSL